MRFYFTIILAILSIQSLICQNLEIIKIGDIIYDKNLKIQNDSTNSYYFFTEDGMCYGINCKYKNTSLNDLEIIKEKFSSNWTKNPSGSKYDENGNIAFDKYLCESIEGNYFYRIGFDYLDVDNPGLVVIGQYLNIQKSDKKPSRLEVSFTTVNSFLSSEEVIQKQKQLIILDNENTRLKKLESFALREKELELEKLKNIYDSTPINEIILPYKLQFNYTQQELTSKVKQTFNDKVIKIVVNPTNAFQKFLGLNSVSYKIYNKNQFELEIYALFYKQKAYSYSYEHEDWKLDKELQNKNEELILKYNKIYGHYIPEVVEGVNYRIQKPWDNEDFFLRTISVLEVKELVLSEEEKFNQKEKERIENKSIGKKM